MFIGAYNSPNLEIAQRLLSKLCGTIQVKRKGLTHAASLLKLWRIELQENKPIPKDYVLYDSTYRTFLKGQKYGNGEENGG